MPFSYEVTKGWCWTAGVTSLSVAKWLDFHLNHFSGVSWPRVTPCSPSDSPTQTLCPSDTSQPQRTVQDGATSTTRGFPNHRNSVFNLGSPGRCGLGAGGSWFLLNFTGSAEPLWVYVSLGEIVRVGLSLRTKGDLFGYHSMKGTCCLSF
jgi:hypothetical protein